MGRKGGVKKYNVAVAGATGAVGQEMLRTLEERKFPVAEIKLLASERSVGKKMKFNSREYPVEELKEDSFKGIEIALFSAGAERSRIFAPAAVKSGAVVIDNSSAFRMDKEAPLVVPEVNRHAIKRHKGIIANPNCSTIQMVVVLKPIHDAAKIKRIIVSTYQSVSGAGGNAMAELREQTAAILANKPVVCKKFPYPIAFNLIPQIDVFLDNAYTKEEMKMVNETRKIMEDDSIGISATAIRVPVFISHSEAVNIETHKKLAPDEARSILSKAEGITVIDDPKTQKYPMPADVAGKDNVYVGRIREDESIPNGLNLWVVGDNLRKGAALNAVQIAEELIKGA
ncbi:MAG: aspartate-semialdehyde dehydrogenase [Candidatus Omnitrophota bacterium]